MSVPDNMQTTELFVTDTKTFLYGCTGCREQNQLLSVGKAKEGL
jgi:hypothetical protein